MCCFIANRIPFLGPKLRFAVPLLVVVIAAGRIMESAVFMTDLQLGLVVTYLRYLSQLSYIAFPPPPPFRRRFEPDRALANLAIAIVDLCRGSGQCERS